MCYCRSKAEQGLRWSVTGGDESRHDHRRRPAGVEGLDVRRRAGGVRARHGCAGDDVVRREPVVSEVAGHRRQRRPRRQDGDPRRRQVRLQVSGETHSWPTELAPSIFLDCNLLLPFDLIILTTFRIPGLIKFGPVDEKEATIGASELKVALVLWMLPTGLLQNKATVRGVQAYVVGADSTLQSNKNFVQHCRNLFHYFLLVELLGWLNLTVFC